MFRHGFLLYQGQERPLRALVFVMMSHIGYRQIGDFSEAILERAQAAALLLQRVASGQMKGQGEQGNVHGGKHLS